MSTKVDWLLKGEPREAQIEAIRRSYYGEALWDRSPTKFPNEESNPRQLHNGPRKGWGHFLQMRLGKTPTFLNEFALFRRDFDYKWSVVFTPAKFKLDWPLEADRFGLDAPSHAFRSTEHEKAQSFIDKNQKTGGLIAVNYEALRYKKNLAILEQVIGDRTFLGADESVIIKNPESIYTDRCLMLSKDAGAIRAMSGKPIIHGPHDIWSQMRFYHELDGINYYAWRGSYCKLGGFKGKQVIGIREEKKERFYSTIEKSCWMPRRVDWMKTFGVDYVERYMPLEDEQMRLYRQMQEDFLVELANGTIISADQIVGKLLKMQQISSGFLYDEFGKIHWLVPPTKNTKLQGIKEILTNELPPDEKALIFTCFTPFTNLLREELKEFGVAGIWKGQTDEELIEEKRRFNNDPNCRVFYANTKAVKYGNTLMGTPDNPCTNLIFAENWYSLDDRAQGEERPQGSGQVAPLTVWDFLCTPHDRAPVRAMQRKEDISAMLMRYDRATGILPPKPELAPES